MTIAQLFEDHLKLAVRFLAGTPLRADSKEMPTVTALVRELDSLEESIEFNRDRRSVDGGAFEQAQYAVNALIDACVDQVGKTSRQDEVAGWICRNNDPHVGHTFYNNLIRIWGDPAGPTRNQLLEIYCLCLLLGFKGDMHLRNDAKVQSARREASERSQATGLSMPWSEPVLPAYDPKTLGTHRALKVLAASLCVAYVVSLIYLYSIAWMGFPRISFGG